MLEKRVRSRLSHRQIHVIPVAAPRLTDASMTTAAPADGDAGDDDAPAGPFQRYCFLATNLLQISAANLSQIAANLPPNEQNKLSEEVTRWNAHVVDFFQNEVVRDCLRQTWEVSTCVGKLKSIIVSLWAFNP